ncbi:MAG: CofH family radical SAM protein [Bacteroidales bacterium]|nr:CofH family radical SAM protein [Bacteroidales bacterium]
MKRLEKNEALVLYRDTPLEELCERAQVTRFAHIPGLRVSYQIDRNVNYTNVCLSGCKFCNFHCRPDKPEKAWTLDFEAYLPKLAELKALGGDQLLLQGGLHPRYGIEFYETLFRRLKEAEPSLKLNALGPPEIAHIARLSKLTYREVLVRLRAAGLDTLPGAGAEILSDRVRRYLSPAKPTVQQWLDVMREAHRIGMSTTATMVYGHIETLEERIGHLLQLRTLQDERPAGTPGFRAFICWPMQLAGTQLQRLADAGRLPAGISLPGVPLRWSPDEEFLRTVAIARLVLDNIEHIQASWLTVGLATGIRALRAGADDMGSIMIEENVVSSAGSRHTLSESLASPSGERNLRAAIAAAGFTPWLRDQQYNPRTPDGS